MCGSSDQRCLAWPVDGWQQPSLSTGCARQIAVGMPRVTATTVFLARPAGSLGTGLPAGIERHRKPRESGMDDAYQIATNG
jgi:hypothetical protein